MIILNYLITNPNPKAITELFNYVFHLQTKVIFPGRPDFIVEVKVKN